MKCFGPKAEVCEMQVKRPKMCALYSNGPGCPTYYVSGLRAKLRSKDRKQTCASSARFDHLAKVQGVAVEVHRVPFFVDLPDAAHKLRRRRSLRVNLNNIKLCVGIMQHNQLHGLVY